MRKAPALALLLIGLVIILMVTTGFKNNPSTPVEDKKPVTSTADTTKIKEIQEVIQYQADAATFAAFVADQERLHNEQVAREQAAWLASHKPKPPPAIHVVQQAVTLAAPSTHGHNWDAVAACESGGNWQDTAGYYDGGLQFDPGTWLANGGGEFAGHAYGATREQQIIVAERVLAHAAWQTQWPVCGKHL